MPTTTARITEVLTVGGTHTPTAMATTTRTVTPALKSAERSTEILSDAKTPTVPVAQTDCVEILVPLASVLPITLLATSVPSNFFFFEEKRRAKVLHFFKMFGFLLGMFNSPSSTPKESPKITSVTTGSLKVLQPRHLEKMNFPTKYKYIVTHPFEYNDDAGRKIEIPKGFLTDGASGGAPDYGASWAFHDYLYSTHKFTSGEECTREEADELMFNVLRHERLSVYARVFRTAAWVNPFYSFSNAFLNSGLRGAEFYTEDSDDEMVSMD